MINNYKSEFEEILDLKGGPVEYELFVRCPNIKMKHQSYPMSIRQTEFNYIRDIIVRYNLKRGLEIEEKNLSIIRKYFDLPYELQLQINAYC